MRFLWPALLLVTACSDKEGDDTGPTQTCDDYQVTDIANVSALDWPSGTTEALESLQDWPGYWYASCGAQFTVHVVRQNTGVDYIETGVESAVVCGPDWDPVYGHDNTLTPLAFSGIDVVISGHPSGAFGTESFPMDVTLFDGSEGLLARAYTTYTVPPALTGAGIPYTDVKVLFRVESGNLSGHMELIGANGTDDCELTGWAKFRD